LTAIEVFDTHLSLGGVFTVSIESDHGDTVDVRIWYGKATPHGWEAWHEWDGFRFTTERRRLSNRRLMSVDLD